MLCALCECHATLFSFLFWFLQSTFLYRIIFSRTKDNDAEESSMLVNCGEEKNAYTKKVERKKGSNMTYENGLCIRNRVKSSANHSLLCFFSLARCFFDLQLNCDSHIQGQLCFGCAAFFCSFFSLSGQFRKCLALDV